MCIAAAAWNAHPRWRLVVAANRDEFHARPAAPLARWDDGSGVIAGRDLKSGGTWLGVSEAGRFTLVTNYRVDGFPQPHRPSRGALVAALLGDADPAAVPIAEYNPFNLLSAAPGRALVLSNHPGESRQPMSDGVHGVSNGAFDAPWPKTQRVTAALSGWLQSDSADFTPLFAVLRDDRPLPGPGPEPRLASVFINNPEYGTRCSTVMAIDHDGHGVISERSFDSHGNAAGEISISFTWPQRRFHDVSQVA
ncbi:MAG: NRDE family protein [Novosphingobium sp.]